MVAAHGDTSTLASLDPRQPLDFHFPVYKNSPRLHGSHRMSLRQPSRTPEYTRPYVAGDPVHLIDWKAFARTDQLLLREHRDEASAVVRIVLEAGPTMLWPTAETPVPRLDGISVTKLETAIRVAFHLAHIHLRMGDLVSIWLIDDGEKKEPNLAFKPRSPSDLVSAFDPLIGQGFQQQVLTHEFRDSPYPRKRCDLLWWIGDTLSSVPFAELAQDAMGSALVQTLSYFETNTSWLDSDVSYFDEGAMLKEYRGQALKAQEAYLKQLVEWRQRLQKTCQNLGGNFLGVDERTSIASLHSFFQETMQAG